MSQLPGGVSPRVGAREDVSGRKIHVTGEKRMGIQGAPSDAFDDQLAELMLHQDLSNAEVGQVARVLSTSDLSARQQRDLLLLAMIEKDCKLRATSELNKARGTKGEVSDDDPELKALAGRYYRQMTKVVTRRGSVDLPHEFAGEDGAPLRNVLTSGFEDALDKIVASDRLVIQSASSTREKETMVAGFVPIRRNGPVSPVRGFAQPVILDGNKSPPSSVSAYSTEYQEVGLLGKGGYGHVYRVKNYVDDREYAVKRILISSERLKKAREKQKIEALLAEVRTLAKLNHTNVVRYFHGWIETSEKTVPHSESEDQQRNLRLLVSPETGETTTTNYESIASQGTGNLPPTTEQEETQSMRHRWDGEQAQQEFDDNIVFGYSSRQSSRGTSIVFEYSYRQKNQDHEDVNNSPRSQRVSDATVASTSGFKASILSTGENEDSEVETIPRVPIEANVSVLPKAVSQMVHFPMGDENQPDYFGSDIFLNIKMSMYPMTLSKYLSWEEPDANEALTIRHCFHVNTSVGILTAILDGIEYLHSQKIVHRDLKPPNIMLSVHEDRAPSFTGCVNIMACTDCGHAGKAKCIYLTPCIGDFGLMAELQEPAENLSSHLSAPDMFQPSQLAALSHKPVGTPYYRPLSMPKTEPVICPKLDVYSLGVIAFEMVYKFGTKAERATVLTNLKKAILPKEFEKHPMAQGIKSMACENRDQRWGCAQVREWLQGLVGKGKGRH